MRTEEEIIEAWNIIYNSKGLTYGYREDATDILGWVLGGEPFLGIENMKKEETSGS